MTSKKNLQELVSSLDKRQTNTVLEVIKNVDISHRIRGVTIQQEFKRVAKNYTGKIKVLLSALGKSPDAIHGVDFMFHNDWRAFKNEYPSLS
jgi:hypothetical protein